MTKASSSIPSDWSVLTPFVKTQASLILMRHESGTFQQVMIMQSSNLLQTMHSRILCQEQKDCLKNFVYGIDVFVILTTDFENSLIFRLFSHVMSALNQNDAVSTITMVISTHGHNKTWNS